MVPFPHLARLSLLPDVRSAHVVWVIQQASVQVVQPRYGATWVTDDYVAVDIDDEEFDDDSFQAHNTSWDSWYDVFAWASARAPDIRVVLHAAPFVLSAGATLLPGEPTVETGVFVNGEPTESAGSPLLIGPPPVQLPREPDYGGRVDINVKPESWKPLPQFVLAETTLTGPEHTTTWKDELGSFALPDALAQARAASQTVVVGLARSFGTLRYTFYDAGEEPVELEPLKPLEPLERLPGYYVY